MHTLIMIAFEVLLLRLFPRYVFLYYTRDKRNSTRKVGGEMIQENKFNNKKKRKMKKKR